MWMNCIGKFQISPRRIFIVPSLFAALNILNIPVSFYTTDLYFLYHIIFLFNRMVFYEEFLKLGLFTKKIPNCIKYQATWWCQIFFNFHPYLENDPIWGAYFSDGLVQPPTSKPLKGPYPTGKTQSQEGLRDAMKNTMRELGTCKGWWFDGPFFVGGNNWGFWPRQFWHVWKTPCFGRCWLDDDPLLKKNGNWEICRFL